MSSKETGRLVAFQIVMYVIMYPIVSFIIRLVKLIGLLTEVGSMGRIDSS